jgi:hypothetical protein
LVTAVERRLDQDIAKLEASTLLAAPPPAVSTDLFVPPPTPAENHKPSAPLAKLVRKFDPALRDAANRKLGLDGEAFVEEIERDRLSKAGRDDLAQKVAWVSKNVGDGLGYDIESYEADGTPIFIEVKTTKGPIQTPFFLSENERRTASEKGSSYRLYRVFKYGEQPQIYSLPGPLEGSLTLQPVSYRARVGSKP